MTNYKPTTKNEGPATTPTAQLDLEALAKIAEASAFVSRQWRTGIERITQVGNDLEGYFAACRAHRDNPRKDHFELAENDRRFIDSFDPETCLALIARIRSMEGALGEAIERLKYSVCDCYVHERKHREDCESSRNDVALGKIYAALETKGDAK